MSPTLLDSDGIIEIFEEHGGDMPIADVHGPGGEAGLRFTREEAIYNAARIVHCVNMHNKLIDLLKALWQDQDMLKPPVRNEALMEAADTLLTEDEQWVIESYAGHRVCENGHRATRSG
jgi:hypothetical protein